MAKHQEKLGERLSQLATIAERMQEASFALQSVRNDLLDQEGATAVNEQPLYATCPLSEYGWCETLASACHSFAISCQ